MLGNDNCIVMYTHCGLCLNELPEDKSMGEFSEISVGFTIEGLQIWCDRHDCNIVHIDFQGMQHPANDTRINKEKNNDQKEI